MPREFSRTDRVADFIKRELALQIQNEMRDPRARFVTVTDVEVSRDLAHANVHVTVVDQPSPQARQGDSAGAAWRGRFSAWPALQSQPDAHDAGVALLFDDEQRAGRAPVAADRPGHRTRPHAWGEG